jgi:hypothetical protein
MVTVGSDPVAASNAGCAWHRLPRLRAVLPSPRRAAGALAVFRAGGNVRAWLLRTTDDVVGDDIAEAVGVTRGSHAGRLAARAT